MKGKIWIAAYLVVAFVALLWSAQGKSVQGNGSGKGTTKSLQPRTEAQIDVVFCLDTTGSMSGLLEGAKQKIWSIVNTVAAAKGKPVLRIALVGYRDVGDSYVTRIHDFTTDLETMYTNLRAFSAEGGGDEPEHVNRALYEAVHQLRWSQNPGALKIVYLVGDAPPHMDYQDGFDYRAISKKAAGRGIIINTVQCGNSVSTRGIWQEIARMAEGKYAAIDQTGGMIAVNTPYDSELARLSAELNKTYVGYGTEGATRKEAQRRNDSDAESRAPAAAAERAASKSGTLYKNESWDLVDAVKTNYIELDKLKPEDLPEELRGRSVGEQERYLSQQAQDRQRIQQQIQELSKKRESHVAEESKKLGSRAKDGFDSQVLQTLQEQGKEKGIDFNADKE